MKINLIVVGKTNKQFLIDGEAEYLKRLTRYVQFEKIEIPELKNAKKLSQEEIKKEEGKLILSKIGANGWVVLLDDKGKSHTSVEFSDWIQDKMNRGYKHLTFVIGGRMDFQNLFIKPPTKNVPLKTHLQSPNDSPIFYRTSVSGVYDFEQ